MQGHAAPHVAVLSCPDRGLSRWAVDEDRISLQVHAAPHVAVLSTGDEVADPSTPHLRPGAIRDANRPMLLAAAADAGATTMDLVRDLLLATGVASLSLRSLPACLPACRPACLSVCLPAPICKCCRHNHTVMLHS
jgi:hypothetical protein